MQKLISKSAVLFLTGLQITSNFPPDFPYFTFVRMHVHLLLVEL